MCRHIYKSDEENWKAVYYRDSHDYDEYELRTHNNANETVARATGATYTRNARSTAATTT